MPAGIGDLTVVECRPDAVTAPLVFSALDSGVAGTIEAAFAAAGRLVLSNAKNYRMDADVPLVIPEVNADHLALLATQRAQRGWSGGIVTNANCAATVAAMALAPIHEAFGVQQVFVTTLQAVSGAGYPGVPSLDILGSVIPYIGDEEPKIEREMNKMLGRLVGGRIEDAPFVVSAHANRVPTLNGHLACLSIRCEREVTVEAVREVLAAWRGQAAALNLPSSPERALQLMDQDDRPQTRRDVDTGRGMTVSVGRVRRDPLLDIKLVALGHNTIRGAAGGSILNAEVLVSQGRLPLA
jgi:aspartate-semialdehyde dehydrogenase